MRCLLLILSAVSLLHAEPKVSRLPLLLKQGGTAEKPAVFDGQGMVIDLGRDVTDEAWIKTGDLWTQSAVSPGYKPKAAGQLAGLFVGPQPIAIPRDVPAEKLDPKIAQYCYIKPESLKPAQMGYTEAGHIYFRWPEGVAPGSQRIILPPATLQSCVTIACSHIIVKNVTAMHAANDGFNIHGYWQGIRIENVKALSNGDEGISAHEEVEMEVEGAEIAWNGSSAGGVADVNQSITRYKDCLLHHNTGAAFHFTGKQHHVSDIQIYAQQKDISTAKGTAVTAERVTWDKTR
jgi:hypothetical protein